MSNNFWQQYPLNSGAINKREGVYPSYFNSQRYIKDTFCEMLKKLFEDRKSYQFYPHAVDYSNIFVTVSFPYDAVNFPVVTVDSMPANNMISDYQNFICDLVDAAGNTYGERYGGLIESNLTITVYAKYTQQRDEVVDIINYGIFQGKRRALESQGITVMTVSIEGESEEEFGQDKIYVMSIGARLYSHWYSDTLYEQIEDIRTEVTSPGPPNNPGLPEDPYTPIRIIHTPAEPIEEPGALARVHETPPCCGVCGGYVIPKENTGAIKGSEFYNAAVGSNSCSCGK